MLQLLHKQRLPLCFSIRFKMQVFLPSTKFYVCSRCHTHIVTEHNFIQSVYRNGLFTGDCIFQHLTNVNYLDLLNEDRVQRVHCKHCDLALGFKYGEALILERTPSSEWICSSATGTYAWT
uniref:protein yippee-like PJ691.02 n=1 Tax=Fragaria vesca subsp. vesca TaxID=101020 RepID=UPI0005CAD671|nr:PREDICTED: protein yippee-like PJ691.02 [Fragaria vesca subsp. vesca]